MAERKGQKEFMSLDGKFKKKSKGFKIMKRKRKQKNEENL